MEASFSERSGSIPKRLLWSVRREALDKQFNLSFDVGNSSKYSGYYFVTDINHPELDVIPVLGSKTEKILCLMIYETDSEISNLLVCKDPEHDMLVVGEYAG